MMMYNLSSFIEVLKNEAVLIESNAEDLSIKGVADNSKKVGDGYLFVCKGHWFKEEYLTDAIKRGAACYMAETKYDAGCDLPYIIVNDIRQAMIKLATSFYRHPSDELDIVGITGTKGKTTSIHMLKGALDAWDTAEYGKLSGMLSTIESFDGAETVASVNTTPEPIELNACLRRMIDNGLKHCALEVSSQALRYGRTDGVNMKVGAFLTMGRDHISSAEHKDFEDYITAKLKIFEQSDIGVVNLDMDYADRILAYAKEQCEKVLTYSMKDENADFYTYGYDKDGSHYVFKVKSALFNSDDNVESFSISIPGNFNASNATAVIAACTAIGEPVQYIKEGIKDLFIEGHMEVFKSKDGMIVAVADYAHNKLSYETLFDAVTEEYPEHAKNISIIYGSVGDKAEERREELGTITGQRAKMSYISADYPGHEPFEKIANEIAHFVELQGGEYEIIENRNEAIEKAFSKVDGPTAILACGFGRLENQKYGDEYLPRESDVDCIIRMLKAYDEEH